ncbi:putative metallophosphoesterase [Campylobacterota bacterium]|nr:putative metallophosphoesterase [Campylobacterota bacterium]
MFIVVSLIVFAAMTIGIAFGYIRKLPITTVWKIALYILLFLTFAAATSYLPLRRNGTLSWYWLDMFASSLAVIFVLFAAVLIGDWTKRVVRRVRGDDRADHAINIAVPIVSVIYLAYGFVSAFTDPNIKRVEFPAPIAQPLKIAHLTDLHLGNGELLNTRFASNIVELTNALNPDIVVITGDLVDAPLPQVTEALQILAQLRTTHGVYYVSGNHEYMYNPAAIMDYLETLNFTVLRNSSARLAGDFGAISIAGTLDLAGNRYNFLKPDPQQALELIRSDDFVLALAHQPKTAFDYPQASFDLMLAGHTHGGQMFPFTLLIRFVQPYVSGLYKHDERASVYVNRGSGYWGTPFRMFAPNEIALITLMPN